MPNRIDRDEAALLDPAFARGIELFNQARFFEAHEVWEEVWRGAEGDEKVLYQALIQAAATLLHVQRGNGRGALSLLAKAQPKLERLADNWQGIDLRSFRFALTEYVLNDTCNPLPQLRAITRPMRCDQQ